MSATHYPEPVLAELTGGEVVGVCDFCTRPGPRWSFPCMSFTLDTYGSAGPWAACERCAELIQAGDLEQLAERSAHEVPEQDRAEVTSSIRRLHRAFFDHRAGPPRPL